MKITKKTVTSKVKKKGLENLQGEIKKINNLNVTFPVFQNKGFTKEYDEPIYDRLFDVKFKTPYLNESQMKILTEQISRISFSNPASTSNSFGIEWDGSCEIGFNLNVIKGKAEPIMILKKLEKRIKESIVPEILSIKISLCDRNRKVFHKIILSDCKITRTSGLNHFDYASESIQDLTLELSFKKSKRK